MVRSDIAELFQSFDTGIAVFAHRTVTEIFVFTLSNRIDVGPQLSTELQMIINIEILSACFIRSNCGALVVS